MFLPQRSGARLVRVHSWWLLDEVPPPRLFAFGPRGAGAGLSGRDAVLHIGPCGQFGANGA